MTDKAKIDILKKIQEFRDSKISPDIETFQKEKFNIGLIKVMDKEGLININSGTLSITSKGDEILRANLQIEMLSKQQEKISSIASQYKSIQDSLGNTMKATLAMQDMADLIKSIPFPITDIKLAMPIIKQIQEESNKFSEIAKIQEEWKTKLGGLTDLSSLSRLSSILPNISIIKFPLEKITSKFLNNSKTELVYLAKNLEIEKDPVYNVEAYEVLFRLEVSLRKLIHERIILKFPKELDQKLPSGILEEWKKRKSEEETNVHVNSSNYELIEYSDFNDLKKIFEKGRNKELFYDLVSEENFKVIVSKLHELDPIRKKIAHSRLLTKTEFEMIRLYYNQIIKFISS